MHNESLEDYLRRATRNFTSRLPEERIFSLGRDLLDELARAHAETPSRHPEIDPAAIAMGGEKPRLEGGAATGEVAEALFRVGALLNALASGTTPDVSWRLDGPPPPEATTVARRAALLTLAAPRNENRFPSALDAARAFERALSPPAGSAPPWPLFRGDAARTGSAPAGSKAEALAPVWYAAIGAVVASPVVGEDLVLAATADGRLVFVDRASGRCAHELRIGSGVESSPALMERLLHLGTDGGELVAVDVREGLERYRVKLGQLVRSSPLPAGGKLLVGVVESRGLGGLVALERETGRVLWKARLGAVFSSPALAGSRCVVGSDEGALHGIELETGHRAWSCPLAAKVRATPAVAGELAVAGDFAGRITAVRVGDGSRAWSLDLGHPIYSSACVSAGLCALGCHDGHVHGIDLASGEPRFLLATRGPVVGSPVAAGERLLVGSTDGDLYLLDASGRALQRSKLSASGIQSTAALAGADVYVGSGDGLHALRLLT